MIEKMYSSENSAHKYVEFRVRDGLYCNHVCVFELNNRFIISGLDGEKHGMDFIHINKNQFNELVKQIKKEFNL